MRTPQEKKRLSLKKDRRNTYGENNKSSRTGIPLRKAKAHRSDRHRQDTLLHVLPDPSNEDALVALENEVKGQAPHAWRKHPDTPLGDVIQNVNAYKERREEQRLAAPASKLDCLEAFLSFWFPSDIRRIRPPEYVALVTRITELIMTDTEQPVGLIGEILQLTKAWEQYK